MGATLTNSPDADPEAPSAVEHDSVIAALGGAQCARAFDQLVKAFGDQHYNVRASNEMISLHARRVMVGMEFRIPNHIWHALYAITALAASSVGCHAGLTVASSPLVVRRLS